jgi:hypothetical protein
MDLLNQINQINHYQTHQKQEENNMKNIKPNKGLINEANDMREMMRKLETSKHQPQQLNEQQPWQSGCGMCHPDCTCIGIWATSQNSAPGYASGSMIADCCCGNEVPSINGCEPGPCMDHTDCTTAPSIDTNGNPIIVQTNPGSVCCYASQNMMNIGFPSCMSTTEACYDYVPGLGSDPAANIIAGCMDPTALNFNSSANMENDECCTASNSGCMNTQYINGDPSYECDCLPNPSWVDFGYGDIACCLVPAAGPGTGSGAGGNETNTGNYVTLGSFGGNPNCFIGETLITMEDESDKRIDEIIIGDIVKSEINTSTVISVDVHKEKEYTTYSLNNSKAFVTEEHPFKTTTGWKAINPVETFVKHGIESNVLEIGDVLITKEGTEELKSINRSSTTVNVVYNLRLDNELVYYADGFLVHNAKNTDDDGSAGGTDVPGFEPDGPVIPPKPNKPNKPLPNASKTRRK